MKSSQELFKSVQNFLYNPSLEIMILNRLKNNENETFLISAEEIKKVIKLDEYFYRLMYEKSSNLPNSSLNKYLTEISRELKI